MKTALLLGLFATTALTAADWPNWRGPKHNGISSETGWSPKALDAGKIAWKAEIGIGFSSFAVANGKVYTTGHADGADTVFCFDAVSGKVLWKHSYPADLGDKYFEGGTTGTPTVDGDKVYQLSRWGDAMCLDAATGKVVWQKNVQQESGAEIPDWGFGGAPLVMKDLLILNVGQSGLALEKATGKIVWKSGEKPAGYSTPLPYEQGSETSVLLTSGRAYLAVNPRSGATLWEFPWSTSYGVNAADPVVQGKQVFISSGYNKGAAVIDVSSAEPSEVWKSREMRTQMNPAVLIDGHLYGIDGNEGKGAGLKCITFATGDKKWEDKSIGAGSLMAADGKLIVLSETGELSIAEVSPSAFNPMAKAKVLDGRCWTVPVLSHGRIYARNAAGKMVCVDVSGK
jgi:outer membrane protein assembly factor BamB